MLFQGREIEKERETGVVPALCTLWKEELKVFQPSEPLVKGLQRFQFTVPLERRPPAFPVHRVSWKEGPKCSSPQYTQERRTSRLPLRNARDLHSRVPKVREISLFCAAFWETKLHRLQTGKGAEVFGRAEDVSRAA